MPAFHTAESLRVALLYPHRNPASPAAWSGTPRGIATGLEAIGAAVTPIGEHYPPLLDQFERALGRLRGARSAVDGRRPVRLAARRRMFQAQLDRSGPFDLAIAMGTDCYRLDELRLGCPVVSYDDATLAQMWRNPAADIRNSSFPERQVARWIATQAASSRAATLACVSTGYARESFIEDYGLDADRVAVVGMGHRPRSLPQQPRDWSSPVYLFVGIDWRRKNGAAVVEAFRTVRAVHPGARLHLVGEHEPISEPGIYDHGLLRREDPAAQAQLDTLFASATAFVLPSRFDPSPIAYLEAASAGVPVIATTEGGAGELLGPAALTVHPDDAPALCSAMLELASPQRAAQMGTAAREASARSSWRHVAERIVTAARSLADSTV